MNYAKCIITVYRTLNTCILLVYNDTETATSIYCCRFYFMDDGIAGTEKYLNIFYFSTF